MGGDGKGKTKFPCSISWMCRKGAGRYSTLMLWNWGWFLMIRAFLKDGDFAAMSDTDIYRAVFMVQMFVTGFVCVVLTPMQGPDVALGSRDRLHCYAAMAYVADHWIANQFVLGVSTFSPYGLGFIATTLLCGTCQFVRADNDRLSRKFYASVGGSKRMRMSFASFAWFIELGFTTNEVGLFLVFFRHWR